MNIVMVGSGNVATVLGKLMVQAGHTVSEVISRNRDHAKKLAGILKAGYLTNVGDAAKEADIYCLAVSDNSVPLVAEELRAGNKIVVHTSGAASIHILKDSSENYGILYPLQTLRKEGRLPVVPLLVDANNTATLETLQTFAGTVCGNATVANDMQRLKLHVAAVVSANFSNHLYALAQDFCREENVSFDLLLPLIQETASRLHHFNAKDMQTGPAFREDNTTMEKHLQVLAAYPALSKLYNCLSESIVNYYQHK